MNKIYLVVGYESNYECTISWNVKAFINKESAETFTKLLNEEHDTLVKLTKESHENMEREFKLIPAPISPPVPMHGTGSFKNLGKNKIYQKNQADWAAYNEKMAVWVEKRRAIAKKYDVEFTSQYDPRMLFEEDSGYEVEEVELEGD